MRCALTTATTFLVTCMLAVLVTIAQAPAAHACDFVPPLELTSDIFTAAESLDDLNAFEGPVRAAYDEWIEAYDWMGDEPPSAIIGVHRVTTVVYATPPQDDVYSGNAGVQVFDAVWGESYVDSFAPMAIAFDVTSCAGEFDPAPLGESEWAIVAEPGSWYSLSPSVDEYAELDAALTRLFGEPVRPELDQAGVDAAVDEILTYAAEDFEQPVTDIQRLSDADEGVQAAGEVDPPAAEPTDAPEPTATAVPAAEPEEIAAAPSTSEPGGSSNTAVIVGGVIVVILAAAAAGWAMRRNASSPEPRQ